MAHAVRYRRLFRYCLALILALVIPYVLVQSTVAIVVRAMVARELAAAQIRAQQQLALVTGEAGEAYWTAPAYAQLTEEQRQMMRDRYVTQLQSVANTTLRVDHPYIMAIVEAIFLPTARHSIGSIQGGAYYPAPRELHSRVLYQLANYVQVGYLPDAEMMSVSAVLLGWGAVGLCVFPMALVLLPVSRRRAQVRWCHILRVFFYSLFVPVLLIYLVAVCALGNMASNRLTGVASLAIYLCGVGPWLGLVMWWWAAIKHYLRIAHAFWVALLLAILVLLLTLAVGVGIAILVAQIAGTNQASY